MTRHRVFIYGSCVSRDTFEHLDPGQFELVQYVARQSALSAYTRPVSMVAPPILASPFQQRMVSGDYASNIQSLIPEYGEHTDLALIDLTDERLGVYVLPDGSVITRTHELIDSDVESLLPPGTQHLAFGSDRHLEYWTQGITAVGSLFRQHMPRAAIILLDIPWAAYSESGGPAVPSFGVSASEANPVFELYSDIAAQALNAKVIRLNEHEVSSSPNHPWGEAPFHYSSEVYMKASRLITGDSGQTTIREQNADDTSKRASGPDQLRRTGPRTADSSNRDSVKPNLFIIGAEQSGCEWLSENIARHPEVYLPGAAGRRYFDDPIRFNSDKGDEAYRQSFMSGADHEWRIDCTPTYFWQSTGSPFSPKRTDAASSISKYTGDEAQVFVVLREPVTRAIAAYWHYFSMAHFDLPQSLFGLPREAGIIGQGFYKKHHDHWSTVFNESRIHIFLYDDLVTNPEGSIRRALEILSLEPPTNNWFEPIAAPDDATPPWVQRFQDRQSYSEQELAALFQLYRPDVKAVEQATGRKLDNWRVRSRVMRMNLGRANIGRQDV
ncbi:hypothetical protein GCM10023216_04980 [Isoptericola chiayiensis]|uniref:Sulfotransferase domain-containing protein n=1 Tax=Isoptericola chiayiensis TaxID=579446 RepID=A0ABP8Y1Z0_9MICO|nr:DUF6270 domain-containing protein [Isoptericola chiayiensis]NOV99542.1 hypothetical protein [Isoptericola chiayiensis]